MRGERKDINVQIGKRLQHIRENNGYTQEKFAECMEVSPEHYRKLESGDYSIQTDKMLNLYREFRIDPTYLITGERNLTFDIEVFLANCTRKERDAFLERILSYMKNLMMG